MCFNIALCRVGSDSHTSVTTGILRHNLFEVVMTEEELLHVRHHQKVQKDQVNIFRDEVITSHGNTN